MKVWKAFTWKIYAEVSGKAWLTEIFDVNIVQISCYELQHKVGHEYCFAAFQTLWYLVQLSPRCQMFIKLHWLIHNLRNIRNEVCLNTHNGSTNCLDLRQTIYKSNEGGNLQVVHPFGQVVIYHKQKLFFFHENIIWVQARIFQETIIYMGIFKYMRSFSCKCFVLEHIRNTAVNLQN